MNGALLLKFCFLGIIFDFFTSNRSTAAQMTRNALFVHPKQQVANEYNDVVIDCMERGNGKVYWKRPEGFSLPKGSVQERGRLFIYNITSEDGGYYFCFSENKKFRANATVRVIPRVTTAGFKGTTLTSSFVSVGLPTTTNPLKSSEVITNTPYPCLFGICNGTCCRKDSVEAFFDCANGQKINMTLVCNRENDCDDGSDESRCSPWPPKITVLPKHKVEVYCSDQDKTKSETLVLECESVGHPSPLIRWKKYEGHVPSKCQQYSKRGHGILTCPNFQQSDQGAYSCVAENSVKMAESQPKSLAKCSNSINCRGFRIVNEEQIEHCLECYCSGKTTSCQNIKSNLTVIKLPFPESQTEIFFKKDGEILFIPTKTVLAPSDEVRKSSQKISYCTLSENDFSEISFLKSFGRNLIIPTYNGKSDFLTKAPDLIIRGNALTLMYTANHIISSKINMTDIHLRFWPGNWHRLNREIATRKDLMKVLSNVDSLFIRCEYQEGKSFSWGNKATVYLESSVITDFTKSVSHLEKCACPMGYEGLSCESCASGYKKERQDDDFICKRSYIPPPTCKEGYKGVNCSDCDALKGYVKNGNRCEKPVCHPDGSVSVFLSFSKNCTCRNGVTGDKCDKCVEGSFHLHKGGCLKCWCSGVTNQCNSSNLYRTMISKIPRGGYNSSDGRNFWLLPSDFSGNRLTSYGGYLNYTMKYRPKMPKENSYLTVEFLSIDDITLIYTFTSIDRSLSTDEKSWFVPLTETNWRKSDGSAVSRGDFLWVLSKLKAIYIESPYHLSSGQANLISTRMSSAASFGDDETDLSLEVEQCNCPRGYTGLSCESCSQGYYKKRNGTVIQCIKCDCSYCDPELGCQDCPQLTYRDNPEDEKIPICKPCPCNDNGVSCVKDDYNQTFCRCKSGFTGMHCENLLTDEIDKLTITISPRRVKGKKVGTAVQFNCSLFSNEEMILSAKKRYRNFAQNYQKSAYNDSGISANQDSKVSKIFEVVLEAGLEFIECFVQDAQGRPAGHVAAVVEDLITFIKPVEITNCYSEVINVKESESKDIICEAKGSPTPTVNWYKSKNHLSAEKVDTSEGVHTIESASLTDNGTIYTCIAENSEGDKAMCTKVLVVRKKCEIIIIFPKEIRVEEGKNISIECKTTAKSSVSWSILDSFFGKEKNITSSRTSVSDQFLKIFNSTVSDSGTYICTAVGENGKINKTVSVIVEEKRFPPTVSILEYDKTLKVGETFEANCNAFGKPVPTITWKKVNGSLESNVKVMGKRLKIDKATVKNSGVYECKARSESGNASSYISIEVENYVPPKINISRESFNVHEGDEVNVTCLAIGYPQPKISWFPPNISLTNIWRKNTYILNEPLLSAEEKINFRIQKDMDDLTMTCFAENSAGRAQASTKIKVLQSQGGINETVEFVPIGSYFELNCDFSGNITWKKLFGRLVGDECPIPNGLMIPSVQNQHNGTYICNAQSDSKKIINLIVIGFVPKFSNASKSYLVLPVTLMSNNDIRIELSFNSAGENGLLLQKGNKKLDVYLEKRKIHLGIYSREGDFLDITMNKAIDLKKWYFLVISMNGNYIDMTIYDEKTIIHERKTESTKDFNVSVGIGQDSFFLGGPIRKARHLRGIFSRRFPHFDGCISRLNIDRHEFNIIKEGSYSHNVTLCRRCSEGNLCFEKGKCLDAPTQYGFICVCPNDFESKGATCPSSCAGKGCETQLDLCAILNPCSGGFLHKCTNKMYSLQCQCAYGYSGTICEKVQEYSFCVKGTGYVRLPSNLLERHLGVTEVIRMSFTIYKPDGQLLWQGDKVNHLSISVRDGNLQYTYLNQDSSLEIHAPKKLELNQKYFLSVWRINSTVTLEIKQWNQTKATPQVYRHFISKVRTNRITGDIYLGNIPNNTLLAGHHVGLNGCIHYVAFQEKAKINLSEMILEELNSFSPKKLYSDSSYDSDESDYNELDSDYKNTD